MLEKSIKIKLRELSEDQLIVIIEKIIEFEPESKNKIINLIKHGLEKHSDIPVTRVGRIGDSAQAVADIQYKGTAPTMWS